MSSTGKGGRRDLVAQMMMAGRENSTRSILFQQTVGHILGLGATDMKCLDMIANSGPSSPTQLAELTGLTTGAVTILIDRLENAGLVKRRADPGDRRRALLVPTRKAMKAVPPLYEPMARTMARLISSYSRKEIELLEDFFNRATDIFRRETEKLRAGKDRKRG